ncbi:MAG: hypothetical protein E7652_03570 [Ruminococcaceae bacterium]|nr:hypothetical protein [Oscillospiraceae bacterium]
MKKALTLFLALAMLVSLSSCKETKNDKKPDVTTAPVIKNEPEIIENNEILGAWRVDYTWDEIAGEESKNEETTLEEAEMTIILDKLQSEIFSSVTLEFNEHYRGRMYVNEDVTDAFIEKLKTEALAYYTSIEYLEVLYGISYEEIEAQFAKEGKTMEDYKNDISNSLNDSKTFQDFSSIISDEKYNYDFAYSILDNQIILTVIKEEMIESGEKLTKTLTLSDGKLVMDNTEDEDIVFDKVN